MQTDRQSILEMLQSTRSRTLSLVAPLSDEEFLLQAMDDTSPPKWHLAHTTWFFEHFILLPHCPGYKPALAYGSYLFNSYYQTVGKLYARPRRGMLARPSVKEIRKYRQDTDVELLTFLQTCSQEVWTKILPVLTTGIHHEKQHQELLLTDIKFNFFANPILPAYAKREEQRANASGTPPLNWVAIPEGVHEIGADQTGFAYDNERSRHKVYLRAAELASRPATIGDYLAFMNSGGYEDPTLWLADGWDLMQREHRKAPLYWIQNGDSWQRYTLFGVEELVHAIPVSHLTYYEADAFARWSKARLPTEAEWEVAAQTLPVRGNLGGLEPQPAQTGAKLEQIYGDVWEWTSSAYSPYPGFQPLQGALGEYNGKFMVNQYVLRGGSSVTPHDHIRVSYRNFFYPHCAWQFSGVRLARDC